VLQLSFSYMDFDKEIFKVLSYVGEDGLSVQKISIHVHNACNTFFNAVSYDEVHNYVAQFLKRNSKKHGSVVERTTKRGVYRLNTKSPAVQEMMLQFEETPNDESENASIKCKDNSLALFDDL